MANPSLVPQSQSLDTRIHCDYARLVRLQAQSFSLLPHLKAGSVLSGRHHSGFRGRGLNFEELRHYQLGDDIRNLDWKVTMRTGKPHVRSYTEEKDRNVVICVDQRSSMFFSSTQVMKSVIAAETAAMCGWRVLKDGDRVGFMIASNQSLVYSKPQRSQNALLFQLKRLAKVNQSLNVNALDSAAVGFSQWLALINKMRLKQSTIIVISDWIDCSEAHLNHLKQLQQHNDVLGIMVTDPLEQTLPASIAANHWVVGDGQFQLNLDSKTKLSAANQRLTSRFKAQRQSISQLMTMKGLPYIQLDTGGHHIKQFQKQVGGRA